MKFGMRLHVKCSGCGVILGSPIKNFYFDTNEAHDFEDFSGYMRDETFVFLGHTQEIGWTHVGDLFKGKDYCPGCSHKIEDEQPSLGSPFHNDDKLF